MAFYTSEADSALENAYVLQEPDLYISKWESALAGVETESSNDITLSPAVSPVYVADAYNSTVGLNLIVQADSSKVFIGKVKDTLVTGIVFDATLMVNIADGTAGTASDWTTASTYNYQVLTADAYNAWGSYFGHCKSVKLAIAENSIMFEKGFPKESIREDLSKIEFTLTGQNFSIGQGGKDVLRALLNLTSYGSQTSQNESHQGFTPPVRSFYRMTAIGADVTGKETILSLHKGQFLFNGEIDFSAEDYKNLPFTFKVKKDSIRPNYANAFMWRNDE